MIKKRAFYLAGNVFLLCASFAFAEVIRIKGGEEKNVTILERTKKRIKIEDARGDISFFDLAEIEKIGDEVINTPSSAMAVKKPANQGNEDAADLFDMASRAVVYIQNATEAGEESIGTGFVIDPSGIIVTNYHVAAKARELSASFKDGTSFHVERVLWKDVGKDLFVFKINGSQFPYLTLADLNKVRIGDKVFVIGNPLGVQFTFSDGMISGVREFEGTSYIQFTAPISPGNSGGPVMNANGEIIGIATMYLQGGQNMNFALSVSEIPENVAEMPGQSFNEFSSAKSPADDLIRKGLAHFYQGDIDLAKESLENALIADPKSARAYNNLAVCYFQEGRESEAEKLYFKAIELDPEYAAAYSGLAMCYLKQGRFPEVEELLLKAMSLDPRDATVFNNLGSLYVQQGRRSEAEKFYLKAIELNPMYATTYYNFGVFYFYQQLYSNSEKMYLKAIELDHQDVKYYYSLCVLYFEVGQFTLAEQYARKVLEMDPKYAAEEGLNEAFLKDLKTKAKRLGK